MLNSPQIVVDTGIISRYAFANRFDLLEELYKNKIIIPTDVLHECWKVNKMQTALQTALNSGWLKQFTIDYINHMEIVSIFGSLSRRFGHGESAVLSIAKVNGYAVGCDDMKAAANYCSTNGIQLIGSIGILYEAFNQQIITLSEADLIHNDMVTKSKFNSPINNFQEAVDWFKNRNGKKLF